jgi:hypothetical protein
LGFRVWDLGFRVQGSGLRVKSLGFGVEGSLDPPSSDPLSASDVRSCFSVSGLGLTV